MIKEPYVTGRWVRVQRTDLTKPKNGMFNIYMNYWWVVDFDDNLLFFKSYCSPQCHPNEEIADRMRRGIVEPGIAIVKEPQVFVPLNPSDYCY